MRIEFKRIALVNQLKLKGAAGVSYTIAAVVGRTALRQQYSTQQKWAYRRFCRPELRITKFVVIYVFVCNRCNF
jgi:hypothetical protein